MCHVSLSVHSIQHKVHEHSLVCCFDVCCISFRLSNKRRIAELHRCNTGCVEPRWHFTAGGIRKRNTPQNRAIRDRKRKEHFCCAGWKQTAYLVPLSPIARMCVEQKLFCWRRERGRIAERREKENLLCSPSACVTEPLTLQQISVWLQAQSNYSISTADCQEANPPFPQ